MEACEVCEMCGNKRAYDLAMITNATLFARKLTMNVKVESYHVCNACAKKLKRYIAFERARGNFSAK